MLSGFKKFILRGNVVDMAVGVVIGAAFGGVVTALTKDLLTPLDRCHRRQAGFFRHQFQDRRNPFPARRFHQCAGFIPAGGCSGLLLRGHAGQRSHGEVQGPCGSDHQGMSAMLERDSAGGKRCSHCTQPV